MNLNILGALFMRSFIAHEWVRAVIWFIFIFMDGENPVVKLCAEGMSLEAQGHSAEAAKLFTQAWQTAADDFEASIAAHYVARHQASPLEALHWIRSHSTAPIW